MLGDCGCTVQERKTYMDFTHCSQSAHHHWCSQFYLTVSHPGQNILVLPVCGQPGGLTLWWRSGSAGFTLTSNFRYFTGYGQHILGENQQLF